ncbi:biofilm peroxide resistance protein BsmA [Erwinia sp. 9145]|uniref:biofilm peroxide resistance protein BsmA n=1 Tax=Erwinia sp. 9145 TaxID=1500895 RepID=UPI00055803F8|nr:biofilm peroxide resistance protein BsmA [Erwinia sp. 9145]
MRRFVPLIVTLLLAGCSLFATTPQPAPAPTAQAQEITRAQTGGLTRLGSISVQERGSPDDAQRAIKAKANEAGANYYVVQLVSETVIPGVWYATAVLYATANGGAQP